MANNANLQIVISAQDNASRTIQGVAKSSSSMFSSLIGQVEKYALVATAAFTTAAGFAIKSASDMQMLRTNLDTLTGSAEEGRKMFEKIYDFAAKTPFETKELADAAQLMLSYGINTEKIMPYLKMLGDVSLGNKEKLQGISLAFSQVQATGRLMGQDLLQMVNQGFNPLQIISEKTGKSMLELKKDMEEGKISADMVTDAFITATSEGGRFYQGMEKGSKTLQGTWETLMDTIGMVSRKMVGLSETGDVVKGGLFDKVSSAVANLNDWLEKNQDKLNAFANSVSGVVSVSINNLSNFFIDLKNRIVEFFTQTEIGKIIVETFNQFVQLLSSQLKDLWQIILDNKQVFELLGGVLLVSVSAAVIAVTAALAGVVWVVGKVIEGLSWLIDKGKEVYNTLIWFFSDLPGNLANLVGQAMGFVAGEISKLPGWVWDRMVDTYNAFKNAWDWIRNDSINWAKDTVDSIVNWFAGLPGRILESITNSANSIGGVVSKFFSGVSKGFNIAVEAKANGGAVNSGMPYKVGERGEEIFVPSTSGTIIPNNRISGGVTVNIYGTVNTRNDQEISDWGEKLSRSIMLAQQGAI